MLLVLLTACLEDRASLSFPVELLPSSAELDFDDAQVTLTTASLTLSDLRLEAPAETAALQRFSLIPVAHAHPGHDYAGAVDGELLGTWTVDLLGEGLELGEMSAWEGDLATASLTLPASPELLLGGTATVGEDERTFSFTLSPDAEVAGIPMVDSLDAEAPPTALWVQVDLAHALSFVDWTTPDDDADGVLTQADGSLANTVLFGALSTPTYTFTLEP